VTNITELNYDLLWHTISDSRDTKPLKWATHSRGHRLLVTTISVGIGSPRCRPWQNATKKNHRNTTPIEGLLLRIYLTPSSENIGQHQSGYLLGMFRGAPPIIWSKQTDNPIHTSEKYPYGRGITRQIWFNCRTYNIWAPTTEHPLVVGTVKNTSRHSNDLYTMRADPYQPSILLIR